MARKPATRPRMQVSLQEYLGLAALPVLTAVVLRGLAASVALPASSTRLICGGLVMAAAAVIPLGTGWADWRRQPQLGRRLAWGAIGAAAVLLTAILLEPSPLTIPSFATLASAAAIGILAAFGRNGSVAGPAQRRTDEPSPQITAASAAAVAAPRELPPQPAPERPSEASIDAHLERRLLMKISPETAVAEDDRLEFAEADRNIIQRWERGLDEDGREWLEGMLEITFAAGQRTTFAHLPFWPAFPMRPEVHCEILTGQRIRVDVATAERWGVRLELTRSERRELQEQTQVAFFVKAVAACSEAA